MNIDRSFAGLIGLALCSSAVCAQTVTGGSFEKAIDGTNGSELTTKTWDNSHPQNIPNGSTSTVYLPGWSIFRDTSWGPQNQYGTGTQYAEVHMASSFPWSPYISQAIADNKVTPSGYTGNAPTGASPGGGKNALAVYGEFAPASTVYTTRFQTNLQNLAVGTSYNLTYWIAAVGETNAGTQLAQWNVNLDDSQVASHTLLNFTDTPSATGSAVDVWRVDEGAFNEAVFTSWRQQSLTFTASSSTQLLEFVGKMQGGPTQLMLDQVSISAVPEPGLATAGVGSLLALAALRRRRRA